MDIDRIPDDENNTDQPREPLARRSFLRRAAAGLLGGAVVTFGLTRPSAASDKNVAVGPGGGGTASLNHVYCCELAYYTYCTSTQISNCSNRWSWTCCAYVGCCLQRVTCGECYSAHCSWTRIGPSC